MSYSFLKISSYYKAILSDYYAKNSFIKTASYDEQYDHLMKQRIELSDFYAKHLLAKGNTVTEIVANASYLQDCWETTFLGTKTSKDLITKQIEFYKPEVLFLQDSTLFSGEQIKEIRKKFKFIKLIIGFSCSPFNATTFENFKALILLLLAQVNLKIVLSSKE